MIIIPPCGDPHAFRLREETQADAFRLRSHVPLRTPYGGAVLNGNGSKPSRLGLLPGGNVLLDKDMERFGV